MKVLALVISWWQRLNLVLSFVIECFEMINEHVVNLYMINHAHSLFVRLFCQHTLVMVCISWPDSSQVFSWKHGSVPVSRDQSTTPPSPISPLRMRGTCDGGLLGQVSSLTNISHFLIVYLTNWQQFSMVCSTHIDPYRNVVKMFKTQVEQRAT